MIRLSEGIFIQNLAKVAQESPNPRRLSRGALTPRSFAFCQLLRFILTRQPTQQITMQAMIIKADTVRRLSLNQLVLEDSVARFGMLARS